MAPGELRRQELGVPIGQQADDDDRPLDPVGQVQRRRPAGRVHQGLQAALGVGLPPAMQAGAADTERQRGGDALLARHPDTAGSKAQRAQIRSLSRLGWAPTAGGQKQEVGSFLVGMPLQTAMRIGAMLLLKFVHARTLASSSLLMHSCLTNLRN